MLKAVFAFTYYKIRTRPEIFISGFFLVVLSFLVLTPLIEIIRDALSYQSYDLSYRPEATEGAFTTFHLERVFTGPLSKVLFFTPMVNSLMIGAGVTILGVFIGSILAFLLVRTDIAFRPFFGSIAVIPYMMPSWVMALA